jgi:putative heme-binding domain-containing protein
VPSRSLSPLVALSVVVLVASARAQNFQSLFDGQSLAGWEGDPKLWRVENGAIVGETTDNTRLKMNQFLIWTGGTVRNFELRTTFRLTGNNNSGVQYRSQRLAKLGPLVVGGYQADIHPKPEYLGMLYDERGRGILGERGQKIVVDETGTRWLTGSTGPATPVDLSQWTSLVIKASGNRLIHEINGKVALDLVDHQADQREFDGILALQVHAGPVMKAEFKEILLRRLPDDEKLTDPKSTPTAGARNLNGAAAAAGKAAKKAGKAATKNMADANKANPQQAAKKAVAKSGGTPPEDAKPQWIWLAGKVDEKQKVHFRRELELPTGITGARLVIACDNKATVFLDGKEIGKADNWEEPSYFDLTEKLSSDRKQQVSKHVLAIEAENEGGPAGLLARLDFDAPWGRPFTIVTDGQWKAGALAPEGWKNLEFAGLGWDKAKPLGPIGTKPWDKLSNKLLLAAARLKEPEPVDPRTIKIKKDFRVERVYSVPRSKEGSWVSMCVDPKGRLVVCDQYGGLYRVTPTPIGSTAEAKVEKIPVDLGEAQGLLWAFDSLYVVVNGGGKYQSGLYRVTDRNKDDTLDTVESLRKLNGGGEHGPHAVMTSPDGKSLFVVCGNSTQMTELASSRVPKLWSEDHLLARMPDGRGFMRDVLGPGGCIYQVSPDGKSWELWSTGFRNEYDAAFNHHGDLFSYDADMEWDINTPWYRPTRVCQAVSGAEFGWRNGAGKWPSYYADSVPAAVDIGPGSPTGVAFGYGAKFPEKYQNAFFICDWSYGKLYAVHLSPKGAGYVGETEEFLAGAPLPLTDLVVNPLDGALYFTVGGRKTTSGLYRVVYSGAESTAPAKTPEALPAEAQLRRKLESFHRPVGQEAVDLALANLGHDDRFVRYAARVALEHQDRKLWQGSISTESRPGTVIPLVMATARANSRDKFHRKPEDPKPDPKLQTQLLDRLQTLDWNALTYTQRVDLLRALTLVFTRLGEPSAADRERILKAFEPRYPAAGLELSTEVAQLLAYLQSPTLAAKGVPAMLAAPTQEEQIGIARDLRLLKAGWTPDLRKAYFAWFPKAAGYKGGASFELFVQGIKKDAVATLTDEEKASLKAVLEAPVERQQRPPLAPPRPFVKEWKLAELEAGLKTGLVNRDFKKGRACHRYAGEGGAMGPDLSAVSGRFSPRDLLESIIEPSKTISDQYEAVTIVSADGRTVTGRIVNLSGDSLMVMTNMLDPDNMARVDRRQVEETKPSKLSMMPTGLLNTLNDEEIRDLMAYLLSKGDPGHPMFRKN